MFLSICCFISYSWVKYPPYFEDVSLKMFLLIVKTVTCLQLCLFHTVSLVHEIPGLVQGRHAMGPWSTHSAARCPRLCFVFGASCKLYLKALESMGWDATQWERVPLPVWGPELIPSTTKHRNWRTSVMKYIPIPFFYVPGKPHKGHGDPTGSVEL